MKKDPYHDYGYSCSVPSCTHGYLWPAVERLVTEFAPRRILEIGCGNGAVANQLARRGGIDVVAVELSESGIAQARASMDPQFPVRFEIASAYDDLAAEYGQFDLVLSLEVVEHVYSPRSFIARARDALAAEGTLVLSTPFHGYWKNLAIALAGKCDAHFDPLWEGGHIKFWSERTIAKLLAEAGLEVERIFRCGRVPTFAKSMVVQSRRVPA